MSTLDKMAAALRERRVGVDICGRKPWAQLDEGHRDAYREDVQLVLRMAAEEIDVTSASELHRAGGAASLLLEIAGLDWDVIETPIPVAPSAMHGGRSPRNKP